MKRMTFMKKEVKSLSVGGEVGVWEELPIFQPLSSLRYSRNWLSPFTHLISTELPNAHRADGETEDADEVNRSLQSYDIKQNKIRPHNFHDW